MTLGSFDNPFTRLDDAHTDIQRRSLEYLDAVAEHQEIQRLRTAAFEMFSPAEGERLLDAGCGLGEVARQLRSRVGASGSVAAVDRSEQAIAVAESRHDGSSVTYKVADITALDYPDGHFDGTRCERVLQFVSDPDGAIEELARVTRPGGRVCVVDTDWASSVWDGFDYVDGVMDAVIPAGQNRASGRALRSRMVRAGLRETTVLPVMLRFLSPADAAVVVPFFYRSVLRERLPEDLFGRFIASVDRSADRGDFLFAFTMWISLGRVAR